MKKIIWTYGLIAGAIVAGVMFITLPMWQNGTLNFDNGELVGYTTMVIALSMIFFGVKAYRDNHLNGVITFGKGLKIGMLITLIAAVMYALAWEVSYATVMGDITDKMQEHYISEMKEGGASAEEVEKAKKQFATFAEYYKNPVIRFGMTLAEILPVGIVISLISAALLKRKEFLPVNQTT